MAEVDIPQVAERPVSRVRIRCPKDGAFVTARRRPTVGRCVSLDGRDVVVDDEIRAHGLNINIAPSPIQRVVFDQGILVVWRDEVQAGRGRNGTSGDCLVNRAPGVDGAGVST